MGACTPASRRVTRPWDELLAGEELAYRTTEPPRAARHEPLPAGLDARVVAALTRSGIDGLYTHQSETWEAAGRGENVIVTTGTASGKSLAFNLPFSTRSCVSQPLGRSISTRRRR